MRDMHSKLTERMVYGMQTADSMIVTYTAPDGGSHEDLESSIRRSTAACLLRTGRI